MLLFLLVAMGLVIADACGPTDDFEKDRFVLLTGATSTPIEQHPYQVAIEVSTYYKCGGAIISKQVVLTAAHCVNVDNADIKVRSGTSLNKKGGQVVHKVLHEDYSVNKYKNSSDNDIAIIFVDPEFEIDASRQIIMLNEHILADDEELTDDAVVAGWGNVGPRGPTSYDLRVLKLPMHSKAFCKKNYKEYGGIYEGQICAGYVGVRNKDVCVGDSGGPLVFNRALLGVVIYGEGGCGQFDHPAVFSEVAYFTPWIHKHIKLYQQNEIKYKCKDAVRCIRYVKEKYCYNVIGDKQV